MTSELDLNKKAESDPIEAAEALLRLLKNMGSNGSVGRQLSNVVERCEELSKENARLNTIVDNLHKRAMEAEKLGLDRIVEDLVLEEDNVEWVVNDIAELGVKIGNQFFFMYKGRSLMYDSCDSGISWRRVYKREFGETVNPLNYECDRDVYSVGEGWEKFPPPDKENKTT